MIDIHKTAGGINRKALEMNFNVIGCGGMGSRFSEGLVRSGLGTADSPLLLFDPDSFENHNLANQFVFTEQVGQPKVAALAESLRHIDPDVDIGISAGTVRSSSQLRGAVVLCLDSMKSRAEIMERHIMGNDNIKLVIETRMDSGSGTSHCFDPRNEAHMACWWQHWFPDEEAENMAGCGGNSPVIGSVFGTVSLALKQLEAYSQKGTAVGIRNRVYEDFDLRFSVDEVWPEELDQEGFAA